MNMINLANATYYALYNNLINLEKHPTLHNLPGLSCWTGKWGHSNIGLKCENLTRN